MQEFGREERVGAEIHRELALLRRDEARDPRLAQVTIQEVRAVRDLSHAKVYFTLMDPAQAKVTEAALNKAAAFLRRRLAEQMDSRKYNGATLVGLNGIVIKSHGSADAYAFQHAIETAIVEVRNQLPRQIGTLLEKEAA